MSSRSTFALSCSTPHVSPRAVLTVRSITGQDTPPYVGPVPNFPKRRTAVLIKALLLTALGDVVIYYYGKCLTAITDFRKEPPLLSYSAKWFIAKCQRVNIKSSIYDFVGRALGENMPYWNRSTLWRCEEWVQNIGHKT